MDQLSIHGHIQREDYEPDSVRSTSIACAVAAPYPTARLLLSVQHLVRQAPLHVVVWVCPCAPSGVTPEHPLRLPLFSSVGHRASLADFEQGTLSPGPWDVSQDSGRHRGRELGRPRPRKASLRGRHLQIRIVGHILLVFAIRDPCRYQVGRAQTWNRLQRLAAASIQCVRPSSWRCFSWL